jgi:hypothetical protein
MSIVSSAGKRQLCSAKQISQARFDDSQAHATQRSVDLVDNEALLTSAASG